MSSIATAFSWCACTTSAWSASPAASARSHGIDHVLRRPESLGYARAMPSQHMAHFCDRRSFAARKALTASSYCRRCSWSNADSRSASGAAAREADAAADGTGRGAGGTGTGAGAVARAGGGDGGDMGVAGGAAAGIGGVPGRLKLTFRVMTTATARPSTTVGVNSHRLTAAIAAASRNGTDRRTRAVLTLPSGSIVASSTTTPARRRRALPAGRPPVYPWSFAGLECRCRREQAPPASGRRRCRSIAVERVRTAHRRRRGRRAFDRRCRHHVPARER